MGFVVVTILVVASLILESQGQFLNEDCGTGSNNPWLAFVQAPNYTCWGSLITNSYILNAAHCTTAKPKEITIHLADSIFNVASVTKHPRFMVNGYLKNNIALIKLEKAVIFNDNIRPICVFSSKGLQEKNPLEPIQQFTLTYWENALQVPKTGIVRRLPLQECTNYLRVPLGPDALCGQSSSPKMDNGTGGSPLATMTDDGHRQRLVQVGFSNFGSLNFLGPTVYTHVSYFLNWIASVVKN